MKIKLKLSLLLLALLGLTGFVHAQGTAFNYQGRLMDNGVVANGSYDFIFTVHDAEVAGNAVGGPLTRDGLAVSAGQFAAPLDFGAEVFTGPARWLEIRVRVNGAGAHATLAPRQALLPTPYATFAASAGNVANGTVTAAQLKTGGAAPAPGQFLSYAGGNLVWSDPAAAVGETFSRNGADAYFNSGKVGIGTMEPLTPLEVNGIVRSTRSAVAPQYIQLNGGDSGSIKLTAQSTLAAEKDLFIQNLSGEATPGPNNNIRFELGTTAAPSTKMTLTRDGNLGLGTTSPEDKLHVYDPVGAVSQRIETGGGVNAWARTEYANADGQWNVGTSRGFNGDQLYFARQGVAGIAFGLQPNGDAFLQGKLNVNGGMAVTSGNVGIGTANPIAKLHVENAQAGMSAVYGNESGNSGVGVYGGATAPSGVGVFARNLNGLAVYADGNAAQAREKAGFVKAMVYVSADRKITRCYNGVTGATGSECGFSIQSISDVLFGIDFGFRVDDRFVSVTPGLAEEIHEGYSVYLGPTTASVIYGFQPTFIGEIRPNSIFVLQQLPPNPPLGVAPASVTIIVY